LEEKKKFKSNRLAITKRIFLAIITILLPIIAISILSIETTKHNVSEIQNSIFIEKEIEFSFNKRNKLNLIHSELLQNIEDSPLDLRSIHLLSKLEFHKGNTAFSDKIMNIALSRSKRDPITNAWLFSRNIEQAKFQEGAFHLDLLLRVAGIHRTKLIPNALYFLAKPEGRKAIADRLREMPPWRKAFFELLYAESYNLQNTFDFMNLLIDGDGALLEEELNPYLEKLLNYGSVKLAHDLWVRWLPDSRRLFLTWPYNRSFETMPSGGPFDWKFIGKNIEMKFTQRKGHNKSGDVLALKVGFFEQQASNELIAQTLVLPPGLYSLRGSFFTEKFRSKRGVNWRVYCLGDDKVAISTDNPLYSSEVWEDFLISFKVPQSNCAAQIVILELIIKVPSDRKVGGNLWFDDLVISPSLGDFAESATKRGE
jgi:hypothetical protein